MELFLDTAETEEIKKISESGLLDGVTTNPSLIAKSKKKFTDVIREICAITDGPVSAEVLAMDATGMLKEARELSKIAKNVVVKIPLTETGIRVVSTLTKENIKTNVTLCFSSPQALLAAKAGATYISPFIGRIDDTGWDGLDLITEIREMYDQFGIDTKIIAASIRNPIHFKESALRGADTATIPYSTFQMLLKHPLTDIGLIKFIEDSKDIQW